MRPRRALRHPWISREPQLSLRLGRPSLCGGRGTSRCNSRGDYADPEEQKNGFRCGWPGRSTSARGGGPSSRSAAHSEEWREQIDGHATNIAFKNAMSAKCAYGRGRTAVASISTLASAKTSAVTPTRAITGK